MKNPNNPSSQLFARIVLVLVVAVAVYYWYNQYSSGSTPVNSPSVPASTDNNRPITPTITNKSAPNPPGSVGDPPGSSSTKFDFYVLVLSWSPDFCAENGDQDPLQCAIGRKLGFVLHGLWPQYDRGYPSDCSTVRLSADLRTKYEGLFPSGSLMDHEWEKHGTCTGLSADQYLALAKRIKDSVAIPPAYRAPDQPFRSTTQRLQSDFSALNSAFDETALLPYCSGSGRYFSELYACFTPDGRPGGCSNELQRESQRSCGGVDFLVRNVR